MNMIDCFFLHMTFVAVTVSVIYCVATVSDVICMCVSVFDSVCECCVHTCVYVYVCCVIECGLMSCADSWSRLLRKKEEWKGLIWIWQPSSNRRWDLNTHSLLLVV